MSAINLRFFRLIWIFVFLLANLNFVEASAPLAPIKADKQERYGFIDREGKLVIEGQFEDAGRFSQGFAPVFFEGAWFFIDARGANAFSRTFTEIKGFKEGLAAVKEENSWGYIDISGKMVIACQFEEAYDFSEGLACVQIGKKEDGSAKYGYIDSTGKFAIDPFLEFYDNQYFSWPTAFSEGLASGWIKQDNEQPMVGYFDRNGETVIAPAFIEGGRFSQGLAPVSTSDDSEKGGRYIKKDGSFAFRQEFARTGPFSDGLAPVAFANPSNEQSWGYIDESGKTVIAAGYTYAEPFIDGIARVFIGDFSNEAYIDTTGKVICSTKELKNRPADQICGNLSPDAMACSSFLPPSKSGRTDYKPENVCDGNRYTAWIEGQKGNGIGEWLEFQYEAECHFKKIIILNGYQRNLNQSSSAFKRNLRPARIKITNEHSDEIIVEVADKAEEQSFELNLRGHNLRITILAVHQTGNEDPDCGFSEITLMGNF